MKNIKESDLNEVVLPGRRTRTAIGKSHFSHSDNMTVGFGYFNPENGYPDPHAHAEEVVFILSAEDAWINFGPDKNSLDSKVKLEAGMYLHIAEGEWHCFGFGPNGHINLLFFYAQTSNIRPEEK